MDNIDKLLTELKVIADKHKYIRVAASDIHVLTLTRDCINAITALQQEIETLKAQQTSNNDKTKKTISKGEAHQFIGYRGTDYAEAEFYYEHVLSFYKKREPMPLENEDCCILITDIIVSNEPALGHEISISVEGVIV